MKNIVLFLIIAVMCFGCIKTNVHFTEDPVAQPEQISDDHVFTCFFQVESVKEAGVFQDQKAYAVNLRLAEDINSLECQEMFLFDVTRLYLWEPNNKIIEKAVKDGYNIIPIYVDIPGRMFNKQEVHQFLEEKYQ